jgi:hypothetical protein
VVPERVVPDRIRVGPRAPSSGETIRDVTAEVTPRQPVASDHIRRRGFRFDRDDAHTAEMNIVAQPATELTCSGGT